MRDRHGEGGGDRQTQTHRHTDKQRLRDRHAAIKAGRDPDKKTARHT